MFCHLGSSSSGNFKLRIYETNFDVLSSTKVVEEIISGSSVGDVDIETIVVSTGGHRLWVGVGKVWAHAEGILNNVIYFFGLQEFHSDV